VQKQSDPCLQLLWKANSQEYCLKVRGKEKERDMKVEQQQKQSEAAERNIRRSGVKNVEQKEN
jgi:hypothetical protein